MSSDESIVRLQNALATLAELGADHERRVSRIEEAYVILIELTQRHSDTGDELRAAQAESEHKIAALVDAQIRTEEAHTRLEDAHTRLEEAHARAEEASARSMQDLRAAQAEATRKMGELADTMARLAERVDAAVRNGGGRSPD